jgi:hypothetical protein
LLIQEHKFAHYHVMLNYHDAHIVLFWKKNHKLAGPFHMNSRFLVNLSVSTVTLLAVQLEYLPDYGLEVI